METTMQVWLRISEFWVSAWGLGLRAWVQINHRNNLSRETDCTFCRLVQ